MKAYLVGILLLAGCVPKPYSDFERAIDGATEEELRALDGAGREGGLLLIALLETDLEWKLQERVPSPDKPKGINVGDPDPLLIVESVGNWNPGTVPHFERFTPPLKPVRKVHVVLSNPWAVLWALERDRELKKTK